ncbi:hypothetical protein Dda_8826 [Drechslerella dactyloides]|uniref:DUF7918 domain-containing protein n=1 Tax=Drechslerella dactyloides TaxID=74499 RepID=A0AAD6NH25_DREDA|nr:hypothetical protein Dda_8826 [Drechslerella dactyloides]
MPLQKGITCNIVADGAALAEHGAKYNEATVMTHVISQDDKNYSIRLNFHDTGAPRHDVEVWADGNKLEYFTLDSPYYESYTARLRVPGEVTGGLKDLDTGERVVQAFFHFARLTMTDDEKDEKIPLGVQKLGTIEVKIWRAKQETSLAFAILPDLPLQSDTIAETLVKGENISHHPGLSSVTPITPPMGLVTTKMDPLDEPWAIFEFKYGSQRAPLKAVLRRSSTYSNKDSSAGVLEIEGVLPKKEIPTSL